MWEIVLLSICLASLKFVVAEDSQQGQVTGILKFSPAVRAPLPSFQPPLNYPAGNLREKSFAVPITFNKVANQFEGPSTSTDNCPQLESLKNILVLLKRLLNQDGNTYFLQPAKRIQILQSLNEYLESSGSHFNEVDNGLKLKELIARTDKAVLVGNNASPQSINDINKKDHVEANLIFRYDIPALNNVGCEEALAALIKTVKDAYLQMINYCNHLGKCKVNSEPDPFNIQHSDNSNTVLALDSTVPTQSKITLSNPSLSNIYDIGSSINNLVKTNNQVLNQKSLSDYSNSRLISDLNSNQYLSTHLNSGVVQTPSNQEKNVNINLNKEASQSNIKYSDKSNVLNNYLSFHNPVPTQVQVTPDNQNSWNVYDVQTPLNNLVVIPQNQGDQTQRLSNGYLTMNAQPQSYLNAKNIISNSALNTGVVKTNSKQTENLDMTNNRYLNIFGNNDLQSIINTPHTFENNGYNPIPLLQTQNVERYVPPNYINNPNQQLYKVSRVVNDNKASVATLNQNNHNIKEQIQFVRGSIPSYEFDIPNYPSYINPNQIHNVGLVSPTFYSPMNTKEIPYLTSLNLNRQNRFNYNSQKADATVKSNFGLNLFAPTSLRDYPKRDIYGNILFDSNRLISAPNLAKLNSVADNDGVVELTYKLKRPQSLSYNPYYMKFRMPYRDYVAKITDFSKNPYMRSNPLKLQQELLAITNFAEASPDIKNIQHGDVSNLILNNGGTLVNAEILGTNDSGANEYLKTIKKLNGNLNTNDILNVVENDRTTSQTTLSGSGLPVFMPEQNYGGQLSYQTVNPQFIDDGNLQRLFSSQPHRSSTPISFTFLPAKVGSQILLNPQKPVTMLANLS